MRYLLLLLFIKAIILAWLGTEGTIGLSPDEAQYWTWSQDLDWGYYSKPPGIAWQIASTTLLFGNTLFGVRLGALIIGFCLSLAVYRVALNSGLEKRTAVWAGIVMALSPLGVYLSLFSTTDGGAILFLALGVSAVVQKKPNYILAGLCIAVGALFKWTALIFWPILLPFVLLIPSMRKWNFLLGIAISLLALLPSLYWNMSHEWATFKHVGTAAVERSSKGNFLDFLGAQIGLLSPVYFAFLVGSYFFLKKWKPGLWIAGAFPAVVLVYFFLAFFKKIQPNWAAYAYPPGFALIAWMGCEKLKKGKIWLQAGSWVAVLMMVGAFLIPFLPVPYTLNPFRQTLGWEKLGLALVDAGYDPQNHFLSADKYQNVSLLSFYGPGQKRAYYFNVSGARKTQFSYWPQVQDREKGKTGYFVVIENKKDPWYESHYLNLLKDYYQEVAFQGSYPLVTVSGKPVKWAMIFKGTQYGGSAPINPEKF